MEIPVKPKVESPTAFAVQGVKGYFPTFRRPGRMIVKLEGMEMHYLSAYKTTDLHDKVALGLLKIISDMYSAKQAVELRSDITTQDMEEYTEISFCMEEFSKMVRGRKESLIAKATAERVMDLASVMLYVVRDQPLDVMPLQWFRRFTVRNGKASMLINRLIVKRMLQQPMEYNFWWLFDLKGKGFRAGLLIEEKKYGRSKYADSILEKDVLAAIKPTCDSRTGNPRIKEVEKAFKDAEVAGYDLYKRGRNNDGELCWVNTRGKRSDYIKKLHR